MKQITKTIAKMIPIVFMLASCNNQKVDEKIFEAKYDKNASVEKILNKAKEIVESKSVTIFMQMLEGTNYPVETRCEDKKVMMKILQSNCYQYFFEEFYVENDSYFIKTTYYYDEPFGDDALEDYSHLNDDRTIEVYECSKDVWESKLDFHSSLKEQIRYIEENNYYFSDGIINIEGAINLGIKNGKLVFEFPNEGCYYYDYINKTKVVLPK